MMLMFFFFNDTATTEIYTLSLHDALPIFYNGALTITDCLNSINNQTMTVEHIIVDGASTDDSLDIVREISPHARILSEPGHGIYDAMNKGIRDRKSTRLNSSHIPLSRMPSSA